MGFIIHDFLKKIGTVSDYYWEGQSPRIKGSRMTDTISQPKPSGTTMDSWSVAMEISKRLGYVPLAFPVAVRQLISDSKSKSGETRPVTKYQIARIFRGANFKSMLYYITELTADDTLKDKSALTVGDMMDAYRPLDLACLMSCYVIGRMVRKVVPEDLMREIQPHLSRESQVGALVGVAIPALGFSGGLLWGSLRHLAHALMAAKDPSSYKKWRKAITGLSSQACDKQELETWGCTSAQVASMLLTSLGFGKDTAQLVERAGGYQGAITTITETDLKSFRLAVLWFDCFATGKTQPNEKLPTTFFPDERDRKRVDARISALKTSPSLSWIERSSADISPQKTPKLFAKPKGADGVDVPDQLQDVFSVEALTKMDEWEFDTLVAQIDTELEDGETPEGVLSTKDLSALEDMVK